MNTATPFPWTGPTAAENVRTGFRSIFEHAPLPAACCNPQGVIIEMNSAFAQALQAGLADQRGLWLSDLVAPDDREATESLLHNLLDCTCDSIRLAGRNTAKNGQSGRSDNGCGMDTKTPRQLFEPFFTAKGAGKGPGLGLTTVRSIVTTNGGLIHVESEADRGTRVKILLPRAMHSPAPEFPDVVIP